ncbi:monocyte chemotactic protein 1B-like isoform X4 [Sebastes umbrosus]|uniref:monocyte chemotactic protein 1B-like isoform X4 n=1 Tax=Sebastes umbrosus TaxID=72105 RepID=UPI0018A0B85A|nr:monocyte chemotactic protein 1B-like isoform X4 [Sebastes umbrosus]
MMMMMKSPIILVISTLLFSSLAVRAHQGSYAPDKCCATFISSRLRTNNVMSYKYTDSSCPMKGVIFKMINGNEVCADPSALWVKKLIEAK